MVETALLPVDAVDAGSYRVIIGTGLEPHLASWMVAAAPARHFAVVSDSNVGPLHAASVMGAIGTAGRASLHMVPAGESSKSRGAWAALTDEMLSAGCGRDTTVVALGGGVIGDLAGFVAATYMRGLPVVQMPTSLLAMIDASVGGKVGVDTAAGKNLVGAFHAPALVIADIGRLDTLPDRQLRAGLAEAIKHGVIADEGYFDGIVKQFPVLLAREPGALRALVTRSVEIKSGIVRQDPVECGLRRTLNFGHTIGHAVEHASGYELLHGEAVAIGMVAESAIAERLGVAAVGVRERLESALRGAGLPTAVPGWIGRETVLAATRLDKKARGDGIEYALPSRIGAMAGDSHGWTVPVDDGIVLEVLR